ncbi:heat shock factor binding protein 1-domain-containing protein [Naematelia encephala]|uniref:Heat shock factor binding protein 1-domain-containing protein n=1 Tax=Naematelia encephala TaxID=71784 RepID=A0A1Y2B2N2_9TREE|nr:heat shock factor binding protein 1-domain-containing protein [Naematelia encephala]
MSAEAGPSTAALAPSGSNIKRLSTIGKHPNQASGGNTMSPVIGANKGKSVGAGSSVSGGGAGGQVFSPVELCGFVDTMLAQLETRFEDHSEQMLARMNDMSTRIDNLENTISDLMNGDIDVPISPSPSPMVKKS